MIFNQPVYPVVMLKLLAMSSYVSTTPYLLS